MTAVRQIPRDADGADVVALIQKLGLRGFATGHNRKSAAAVVPPPAPAGKNEVGEDVVKLVQTIGLRGFAKVQQ